MHDKDTWPINIMLSIRYHVDETRAFRVKEKKENQFDHGEDYNDEKLAFSLFIYFLQAELFCPT